MSMVDTLLAIERTAQTLILLTNVFWVMVTQQPQKLCRRSVAREPIVRLTSRELLAQDLTTPIPTVRRQAASSKLRSVDLALQIRFL